MRQWQPWATHDAAVVEQGRGAREDCDGDEGQTPEADPGRGLRQRVRRGQRIADRVPGKAGEDVAAQPFGDRQCGGKAEDSTAVGTPHRAGKRKARGKEQSEAGGEPGHGDRQQPAECRCVNQEGVADPVEPGEKVTEAEPPATQSCRRNSTGTPASGAVDQQDQNRKSQKQHRPRIERRKRQNRHGAGRKGDQRTSPAPGEKDTVDETCTDHEWPAVSSGFC